MPTVHVAEVLRRYAGDGGPIPVEGATVGAALAALFAKFPALRARTVDSHGALWSYLVLFCNDAELPRESVMDIPLAPGDVLEIVGAAEGGSGAAPASPGAPDGADVRMRGFRSRLSVEAALAIALDGVVPCSAQDVALDGAVGRVLAADVVSSVDVPSFARSAMDGYAVCAEDTFGATQFDPVSLVLVGESMPGAAAAGTSIYGAVPVRGVAVRIMTGAPVPDTFDAVLPAESAHEEPIQGGGRCVVAESAVTPGKNVGRVGEDVRRGDLLLRAGRRLRPQDVGLLASIGAARPSVVRRPRVVILVTGNELLAAGEAPSGTRIVDSNTPMLAALVARDGGMVVETLRLADDIAVLRATLERLRDSGADVLVAAGGTSVGREDFLPVLVRELGQLPVHGVAMRPSSPTGLGRIGGLRVFLLPGNPVSCLAAYDVFAGPVIRALGGRTREMPYPRRRLRIAAPLSSQIGRLDYCRVQITPTGVVPLATSGASVLSSTTRADGFLLVPENSEGFAEGAEAQVFLYDFLYDESGPIDGAPR